MGGIDKGLLQHQDRPMAAHVQQALSPWVTDTVISCNRNLQVYRQMSRNVVQDEDPLAFNGPLAGLLAGMRAATALGGTLVLVSPCDTPRLDASYGERLLAAAADADRQRIPWEALVAQVDSHPQWLHGLLNLVLVQSLEHYLKTGGRSARGWLKTTLMHTVDFSDHPDYFQNINEIGTPEGNIGGDLSGH